jgi:uncharacterized membrane protein
MGAGITAATQNSTGSMPFQRVWWLRPKYLLFAFIGLMAAYVLRHNESFLVNPKDPEWQHIQSFKWWLLPHGVAGACALLLAPLQFSDRLRQRFTKLHRVVGRSYVAAVFIAAPMGVYIQHLEERIGGTHTFTIETVLQSSLWMLSTGVALAFILKGKVQQHRQWMTRSFAGGPLVFLEVRVIEGFTGWHGETIVWACVVCAIPLADLVLQWQELHRTRSLPAKAQSDGRLTDRLVEVLPER